MFNILILLIIAGKMNLPMPYLVAIYIIGSIAFIVNTISLAWNSFVIMSKITPAIEEFKEILRKRSEQ